MRAFSFPNLKRKSLARTAPHANLTVQSVNVKPPKGHRCVIDNDPAPIEFDLTGCDVDNARKGLPNAPREPSENLKAARHAAVLDLYRIYLTDPSSKVPPPAMCDVIDSLAFASEDIFDRILIA